MNGLNESALEERRRYVDGWNDTMLKIWQEQIRLLGVIDTGRLMGSLKAVEKTADSEYRSVRFKQSFALYGIFQDRGTGRETYKGNPGDIGHAKVREVRPWFSLKLRSSIRRINKFLADNAAKEILSSLDPMAAGGECLLEQLTTR